MRRSRENARQRNIEHSITLEDIKIPQYCPYLNIALTFEWNKTKSLTDASVDRIDSSKGYIPGNVQIISLKANIMKNNATEKELIMFAHGILNVHSRNAIN